VSASFTNYEPSCAGQAQSLAIGVTAPSTVDSAYVEVGPKASFVALTTAQATITAAGGNAWTVTASWILPEALRGVEYEIRIAVHRQGIGQNEYERWWITPATNPQ